jgi:hypothetical protein
VVLVYPLGVATLGLQLWAAYGYSLQESVYAASLAPAATAVARIFSSLFWFLSSFTAAAVIAELVRERSDPRPCLGSRASDGVSWPPYG